MKPWLKILIGLVLGVIVGLILNRQVDFILHVGKTFINLLKMVSGLIIFSSLVVGMCHISDPKKLGRIGFRALFFFIVTTLLAVAIGLCVVYAFEPGKNLHLSLLDTTVATSKLSILEFIFGIIPSNPIASFAEGNILQIIMFAILFALAINISKEKGQPILKFFESLSDVMITLTQIVMKFAPIGVFALMASAVGMMGSKVLVPLFWAVGCIFLASLLHVLIIFASTLRYLAKVDVVPFFKGMKDAIIVALSTSSSSATLPISLDCTRQHLGISKDISGFVLSLGTTINMNGTAIGQAVLAIFIAQAYGVEISFLNIIILMVTTLISAIGTAGIPGSGLIMLSIVLNAMGLPIEGIALVAGIDRLRDMCATVVNVLGDAVAAVYIATKEKQINREKYHSVTWAE